MKNIEKFQHQNNISVNVYGCEDKKNYCYLLPPWALQDIAWIYYISLLVKHLITYCWKTWADWYQDKIIITTTKNISGNIVYVTKPVKRYWRKKIWKDASYTGHKESSSQKLMTRRSATKSSLQKQNTNCVCFLSSMWISKVFYLNKTCVGHCHENPSSPNTNNTYHVGAASTWNPVMGNTLNHPK